MTISTLNATVLQQTETRLKKKADTLQGILKELQERELSDSVIASINAQVDEVNAFSTSSLGLSTLITKKQAKILNILLKEYKIVPKGYYRNLWMVLGMSAFGVPFGVIFGLSLDNMAFLGIGMPIGMALGMSMGIAMDQKAFKDNRQLRYGR